MDFTLLYIIPMAFVCEFMDSSLGMGYGTTLSPLLLLMGFEPLQVVPAILVSELFTGATASVFHHNARNADFSVQSKDTKVAAVLSVFALVGTVAAVFMAVKLPARTLKLIIGLIVVAMGVIIALYRKQPNFSWRKISLLGMIASFNKGMSGGGYGPLVMGGQILSGVGVKNAVGITSFSESVTCLAGVVLFFVLKKEVDWALAPWLTLGALLSVPFAVHAVKWVPERGAKTIIAIAMLILGSLTLKSVFM